MEERMQSWLDCGQPVLSAFNINKSSQQEQMFFKTTPILTSRKAKRFFTAAKSFFGSFAAAFSNLKKDDHLSEQMLQNLADLSSDHTR